MMLGFEKKKKIKDMTLLKLKLKLTFQIARILVCSLYIYIIYYICSSCFRFYLLLLLVFFSSSVCPNTYLAISFIFKPQSMLVDNKFDWLKMKKFKSSLRKRKILQFTVYRKKRKKKELYICQEKKI